MSSKVAIRVRADDREAALLVGVEPAQVQVGRQARTGSAGSRRRRPRRPGARSDSPCATTSTGLLAGQMQDDRDVVGAEAPQRVLVGAQLAEVEAVAVDVVDRRRARPSSASSLSLRDARVVLEQVADHQHAARRLGGRGNGALGVGDRLGERLLDEAVLAGLEHRDGELGVVGTGVASATASSSGSASSSSRSAVIRASRELRAERARARPAIGSQHQRSSRPGQRGEVACQVRAPVAEPGDADADVMRGQCKCGHDALGGPPVPIERGALRGRRALERRERPPGRDRPARSSRSRRSRPIRC